MPCQQSPPVRRINLSWRTSRRDGASQGNRMKTNLKSRSKFLRSPVSFGLADSGKPVDRTGGDNGAGCIYGLSVIMAGEALGHDQWIDATFLQQVADAINASPNG